MSDDLDDWDDEEARELYLITCNSGSNKERDHAIRALGKLARNGSSKAGYALRLIARSGVSSSDREMASRELSKT